MVCTERPVICRAAAVATLFFGVFRFMPEMPQNQTENSTQQSTKKNVSNQTTEQQRNE